MSLSLSLSLSLFLFLSLSQLPPFFSLLLPVWLFDIRLGQPLYLFSAFPFAPLGSKPTGTIIPPLFLSLENGLERTQLQEDDPTADPALQLWDPRRVLIGSSMLRSRVVPQAGDEVNLSVAGALMSCAVCVCVSVCVCVCVCVCRGS